MFNFETLTGNELALIENLSGQALTELGESPSVKGLYAMAYVAARREQPGLKFNEVMDWPLTKVNELLSTEDDDLGEELPSDESEQS